MCYQCDDKYWLQYVEPDGVITPCPYYNNQIDIVIHNSAQYYQTTIELRCGNSIDNMGYVFSNEVLAMASPNEVYNILVSAFAPFIEKYPQTCDILANFVKNNYTPPVSQKYIQMHYTQAADTNTLYDQMMKKYSKPTYITDGLTIAPLPPGYEVGGRRPEVDVLPGLKSIVKYPGQHPLINVDSMEKDFTMTLERAIIRLNDRDKWTREQIADWLETLDVDITFRSENADEV